MRGDFAKHCTLGAQKLAGFDEGPLPDDWLDEWHKRGITVTRDLLRDDACAVLKEYGESGLVY